MSFKNLGTKQTIVLHNCEIDNQNLVITPHTQTVGYIRTKRLKIKRKKNKQTKTNHTKKIFKK